MVEPKKKPKHKEMKSSLGAFYSHLTSYAGGLAYAN